MQSLTGEFTALGPTKLALYHSTTPTDFPGLTVRILMRKKGHARIFYVITCKSTPSGCLFTTVYVNGVENPKYRCATGPSSFHTNSIGCDVYLKAGIHDIVVYYATSAPGNTKFSVQLVPNWDASVLQVNTEPKSAIQHSLSALRALEPAGAAPYEEEEEEPPFSGDPELTG